MATRATQRKKKKAKKTPARPGGRAKTGTRTRAQPKKAAPAIKSPQPMVTTTFRLPMDLLGELRVAATVRRNRFEKPYTQGAIVEAALRGWLATQK